MMKYLTKFATDIFPSVAATVIGAYIVNHYIIAKPDAPAAATISTATPQAADRKPAEKSANASSLPEAGVKARGMSERTLIERAASEKAAVIEKPYNTSAAKPAEKSTDAKPADLPADTASVPVEPRRPREKAVAKVAPPSVPAPALSAAPATSAPNPAPPVEAAAATPEDRPDANDLARAAIERQRGGADNAPASTEIVRAPDGPHASDAARTSETPRSSPAVRPLPPPITVSTTPNEVQGSPPKPDAANAMEDARPTPPADIPLSRPPLELRADAADPSAREHTTVAEDMLSAAKSVFHAVLPR